VATGLSELDVSLGGGLECDAVHLLVGKPGQAKTQLAVQIAVNAARLGTSTGIVSLELNRYQVARLVAAQVSGLPRSVIAKGKFTRTKAATLKATIRANADMPLVIADDDYWQHALTRTGLADVISQGCDQFKWRLVVLDYLGLLANEIDDGGDYAAACANSTALKHIARDNCVAFLVVAALRKSGTTSGQSPTPLTLDDVAGPGRIVYDATTVVHVECDLTKTRPGCQPVGNVFVRPMKSRFSGATTDEVITLAWLPACGRISNDGT
jgi:predicted ATP-dependent serine protease